MKSLYLVLLAVLLFSKADAQFNVLFGERDLNEKKLAVYFDKNGAAYPDYVISNSSLEQCNASLHEWYEKNPADFQKIARQYKCNFDKPTPENLAVLEDSILMLLKRKLNSRKAGFSSLAFMIHGYRKPFRSNNYDVPSPKDFTTLQSAITKHTNASIAFVEVYWDGLYDCCFSASTKRNEELFKLFVTAQNNAMKVSRSVRKLLFNLNYDKITLIGYSLGAKVASAALFDVEKDEYYTPENKRVNLCLLAPAMPGEEVFENYYKRHSSLDYKVQDNYRLMVIYNENDFVLKKKDPIMGTFGPGPYQYGVTTLGCNCDNATINLEAFFSKNFPTSPIKKLDLSEVGRCHLVSCYSEGDNLKELAKFISE